MPDDADVQPLPRGQVDYLSHNWEEEDVARSWRNMTKQKYEITNGVRLENASWRTWWKQRNKLKTVSPETLNWLKDSDVTWLYGPLHTAVDWSPPKRAATSPSPSTTDSSEANSLGSPPKSNILPPPTPPGSVVPNDRYRQPSSRYGASDSQPTHGMKPILKHRSISEILTGALPAAATSRLADPYDSRDEEEEGLQDSEQSDDAVQVVLQHEKYRTPLGGKGGRPLLFHTHSDTNILPRFGRSAKDPKPSSPPRVAPQTAERSTEGHLSADQRTGATSDLVELAYNNANATSRDARSVQTSGRTSVVPYWDSVMALGGHQPIEPSRYLPPPLEHTESNASDTPSIGKDLVDSALVAHVSVSLPPQKKHISFNAIVEQCIAIESNSAPISPKTFRPPWAEYDNGYQDGLYEDIEVHKDITEDEQHVFEEDDDEEEDGEEEEEEEEGEEEEEEEDVLEMKPPSRRGSLSGLRNTVRPVLQPSETESSQHSPSQHIQSYRRASPRRSKSRRSSLGKNFSPVNSGSGSNCSSNSASRSRSAQGVSATEREHVTIAPIAPTILKTVGADKDEEDVLYMTGTGSSYRGSYPYIGRYYDNDNYGCGYGCGERVSVGGRDIYEQFERGGELMYQSTGIVHPWGERDAIRYRMDSELGMPSPATSPPRSHDCASTSSSLAAANVCGAHASNVADTNLIAHVQSTEPGSRHIDGTIPSANQDEIEDVHMKVVRESKSGQQQQTAWAQEEVPGQNNSDSRPTLMPYLNDGADNVNLRGLPGSGITSVRESMQSPDYPPKVNPRIASLKSETAYRSPSPSLSSVSPPPVNAPLPSGASAIPTPGISPAHELEYAQFRSPPMSPSPQSGLLSPPDMSPRGRFVCASPVSSCYTSSSSCASRSESDSGNRNDERGRSRGRNSSLSASASADQEPERGRSRSRSMTSGANSSLSDSSSPHARVTSAPLYGIGVGIDSGSGGGGSGSSSNVGSSGSMSIGIGGVHPSGGRDVRDRDRDRDSRGDRVGRPYRRMSSEDNLGPREQERGRSRDTCRRAADSLSPPSVHSDSSRPQIVSTGRLCQGMAHEPERAEKERGRGVEVTAAVTGSGSSTPISSASIAVPLLAPTPSPALSALVSGICQDQPLFSGNPEATTGPSGPTHSSLPSSTTMIAIDPVQPPLEAQSKSDSPVPSPMHAYATASASAIGSHSHTPSVKLNSSCSSVTTLKDASCVQSFIPPPAPTPTTAHVSVEVHKVYASTAATIGRTACVCSEPSHKASVSSSLSSAPLKGAVVGTGIGTEPEGGATTSLSLTNRAADLVLSARSLLNTIWGGSGGAGGVSSSLSTSTSASAGY